MQARMDDVRQRKGFTLMEVLVAIIILAVAMVAMAAAFIQQTRLVKLNQERTMAINAAQGMLEAQVNRGFASVLDQSPDGRLSETTPEIAHPVAVPATFPTGVTASGWLRVRDVDNGLPGVNVLEIRTVVCWRSGGRLFGEDANLNGILDPGEDLNGNNMMDSPAVVETRMAKTN